VTKRNKRKYGISRRLGVNLWGRAKDPVARNNFPPGQHGGLGYKKLTDHGVQLQAKQKLRKYYGDITERQFKRIYEEASRRKGDTSENLVGLLESRLDTIVYRSNFVPTIFAARQFVNHGHVKVNGKKVTIPSFTVKPGQIVEIGDKAKQMVLVVESLQTKEKSVPDYLEFDADKLLVKFLRMPTLPEIPYPVIMEPNLVIEFYSK
jgi:small subunit ribosomal protein S4